MKAIGVSATLRDLTGPIIETGLIRIATEEISIVLPYKELSVVDWIRCDRVDSRIDRKAADKIGYLA